MVFDLRSSIIFAFAIAAYPVWLLPVLSIPIHLMVSKLYTELFG